MKNDFFTKRNKEEGLLIIDVQKNDILYVQDIFADYYRIFLPKILIENNEF